MMSPLTSEGIRAMDRTTAPKPADRQQIVYLLNRLPREDAGGQLRTASALAWIGIQARKSDAAVRGRLSSAARGRVDAMHFMPALEAFPSLPLPVRREVAMFLGDLAGSVAVTDLVRLATSPDAGARLIAVDALGKIGGPQAVAAIEAAVGDVNETVRTEAVRALGQLSVAEFERDAGAPEMRAAENLLRDVSRGDPSEYVRQVTNEALAAIQEAGERLPQAPGERIPSSVLPVST
jgi:HEAT repeat protein